MIETAQYHQDINAFKSCEIVDYDVVECTYDCNCNGDGQCDQCFGTAFDYTVAVNPSLCGKMLKIDATYMTSKCPMSFKEPGSRYACYLDCEAGVFTFSGPDEPMPDGVVVFIVGIILFCGGLCLCNYGYSKCRKHRALNTKEKEEEIPHRTAYLMTDTNSQS